MLGSSSPESTTTTDAYSTAPKKLTHLHFTVIPYFIIGIKVDSYSKLFLIFSYCIFLVQNTKQFHPTLEHASIAFGNFCIAIIISMKKKKKTCSHRFVNFFAAVLGQGPIVCCGHSLKLSLPGAWGLCISSFLCARSRKTKLSVSSLQ